MSSMRSASSSTSTSTSSSMQAPWLMRSSRRPGVATSTSHPRASALFCGPYETPPTTVTAVCPVRLAMARQTSSICWASSRVGVTTSMRGPQPTESLPRRERFTCGSLSSVGSRKAAVLPVPVWAAASRSRPASTSGMERSCTGVGCS